MTVAMLINGLLGIAVVVFVIIVMVQVAKFLKSGKKVSVLGQKQNAKELAIIEKLLDEDTAAKERAAAIARLEEVILANKGK